MATQELSAFELDDLTHYSLVNALTESDSFANLVSADPSIDTLQITFSFDRSLDSISITASLEETVCDVTDDSLEVLDASSNDLNLFDSQTGLAGETATDNLGGLYDDPIEYGTPLNDAYYWRQQQGNMSCAVVAQITVYHSLTGRYISETAASNYAQSRGWFDPVTGTPEAYVGNLLNALGVQTDEYRYANLNTLAYALANGDKPIVGLDGNEIWSPKYDWYGNPIEQRNAGHAVWVTGIDYEQDGSVNIILNDSGTSSGMASVVDYYDFMNAWQDYNRFVSIADNPYA